MFLMYLGIIVAVGGFIGVLACAKMAQKNPNIQPLAIVCALVMLVGVGMYGYVYWNKAEFEARASQEKQMIFDKAIMSKVGNELKGKKVLLITSDTSSEYAKARLEVLNAAVGSEVQTLITNDSTGMESINDKSIEKTLSALTADDVVLMDTDAMNFTNGFAKGMKKSKAKFAFTYNGFSTLSMINAKDTIKAFKDGKILFVVVAASNASSEFEPSEDDLNAAFSARYELLKEYNKEKFMP